MRTTDIRVLEESAPVFSMASSLYDQGYLSKDADVSQIAWYIQDALHDYIKETTHLIQHEIKFLGDYRDFDHVKHRAVNQACQKIIHDMAKKELIDLHYKPPNAYNREHEVRLELMLYRPKVIEALRESLR